MTPYRKIIAVKLRRLGDTILWTSSLQATRDHFSQSVIDLVVPKAYASLFEGDPRFRRVLSWDEKNARHLGRDLAREKYDLFLGFHVSSRAITLGKKSRASAKVLHHHDRSGKEIGGSLRIPALGKPMPAIQRDLNVVRAVGWDGATPETRLHLSGERRERMKEVLAGMGWDGKRPLLFIHPGASRPAKLWGLERYAKLVRLLDVGVFPIIILESLVEWEREALFLDDIKRRAPVFSTKELGDLAAALSWGTIFVGSDSGIKHMAIAVGVPTVTLFGPESVGEWHGYDPARHRALQKPVLCRSNDRETPTFAWCGVEICPFSSHACLSLISPEEVLTEIRRFL